MFIVSIAFRGFMWRSRHGFFSGKKGLIINCGESGDELVRVRMIVLLWIFFEVFDA